MQAFLVRCIDHWSWTSWMAVLTIYALFGDDIRLLATSIDTDTVFYAISAICMGFFVTELVLASVAKPGYWLSFYFFLDFIACISMISDIGWIWSLIIGDQSGKGGNLAKTSQIARAARASRAGTRAGRIIRVVRVARLIRVVKLYKLAKQRASNTEHSDNTTHTLERSIVVYRGTTMSIAPALLTHKAAGPRTDIDSFEDESMSFEKAKDPGKSEFEPATDINTCTVFGSNSRRTSLSLDMRKLSIAKVVPLAAVEEEEAPKEAVPEESKVGMKLSDLTAKRVIVLILGMMFCLPLFSTTMYISNNTSYEYALMRLDQSIDTEEGLDSTWDIFIQKHSDEFDPLAYVEIINLKTWQSVNPNDLRPEEKHIVVLDQSRGSRYYVWAVQDMRPTSRMQAGLNIARTIFICFVITIVCFLFSKDANELVLGPIENMTNKIRRMIEDPLGAVQEAELDQQILQEIKSDGSKNKKKGKKRNMMETELLENTIVKIGSLLVLGFGEAGAEIIASNMKHSKGEIDPIVDGKKVYSIFGFCDIRDFFDVAEVLQEGVMTFVNEIAFIVHSTVYKYSGAANKNIGDAFLLVWKLPKGYEKTFKNAVKYTAPYDLTVIADLSVVAFLKILAAINSDKVIISYRTRPELLEKLPNYSLKMGFGLHVGWAIEGAIGSEFKVDASYLSPNVNLASRLEAATRQFGVPMLFSGQLYDILSPEMRKLTRQIDCVLVKGSKVPIRLYTIDVDLTNVPAMSIVPEGSSGTAKQHLKREREHISSEALNGQEEVWGLFESDPQLMAMRQHANERFMHEFQVGFEAYLLGEWGKARRELIYAQSLKKEEDGPIATLLAFMNEMEEAPANWKGFRELTEK